MSNLHLYVPPKRIQVSFKNVPKTVLPSQAMTLKEIIRRFMRHESLPVKQEGIYEDRMGDLEKMANEDITVQYERIERLKAGIAAGEARAEAIAQVVTVPPKQPEVGAKASNGFAGDGAAAVADGKT